MKRIVALTLLLAFISGCGLLHRSENSHLMKAEELSRQGRYDEAITEYQRHMEARLAVKNRPEWENPSFYLLLIGDIELGRGNVESAGRNYELAAERGVDQPLISDRYRSLSYWYETHGQLKEAIAILEPHRSMDPILIEAILDRLAKRLLQEEEQNSKKPRAAPTP